MWLAGAGVIGLAVYAPIAWPLYKKWMRNRERQESGISEQASAAATEDGPASASPDEGIVSG